MCDSPRFCSLEVPTLVVHQIVVGLVSVTVAETAVIYTDDPERLAKLGRLLPTRTGANVVLAKPFDPIVFGRLRRDGSYPRASVAQTAIDLLTGNARMPQEGEALLGWMERNEPRWRLPGTDGYRQPYATGSRPR